MIPPEVDSYLAKDTGEILRPDRKAAEAAAAVVIAATVEDGRAGAHHGDALFAGGCGRRFDGTAEIMWNSLQKLAALPDETHIYCAHEYTLANLEFARWADPDNTELANYQHWCQQQRELQQPTLPTPLAVQRQINPFLRAENVGLQHRWQQHNAVDLFAALRSAKDRF